MVKILLLLLIVSCSQYGMRYGSASLETRLLARHCGKLHGPALLLPLRIDPVGSVIVIGCEKGMAWRIRCFAETEAVPRDLLDDLLQDEIAIEEGLVALM